MSGFIKLEFNNCFKYTDIGEEKLFAEKIHNDSLCLSAKDFSVSFSKSGRTAAEFSNCFLLPGFCDVHVHFREPGFSYKETIKTGSMAAAELNCNKAESIYIGDTDCDMQTGKNGGIFTIGALWGFRTKEELEANDAGFIAENPLEIIEYLKKHQAD